MIGTRTRCVGSAVRRVAWSVNLAGVYAIKEIAAAGWTVQAADDVEQSGLSGAGWTGDRQPLAALHAKIDIDERVDGRFASKLPSDLP